MLHTLENPVRRCSPSEDVVPFSECRNNFSAYIERARETHRTTLVTQNGHAAVYIVNATDFDNLMDKIDLWRDVETSRREIAEARPYRMRRSCSESTNFSRISPIGNHTNESRLVAACQTAFCWDSDNDCRRMFYRRRLQIARQDRSNSLGNRRLSADRPARSERMFLYAAARPRSAPPDHLPSLSHCIRSD